MPSASCDCAVRRASMAAPIGRSIMLASMMAVAPIAAAASMPEPHNVPTAADAHSVAAVLSPDTDTPCLRITPAPRKPMPDATCAATRVGSPVPAASV